MSLRDTAVNDLKVLANEALTNTGIVLALDYSGINGSLFDTNDSRLVTGLKSGLLITGVSWLGSNLRNMWPWMNVWG
jgi:hypothetical protein